jgi:hypothetical protein
MDERIIPSFPNYQIKADGTVTNIKTGKILKARVSTVGRYQRMVITLGRGNHPKLHRLICETFNGPCPGLGYEVAHLNGDSLDNRPENLAWKTRTENERDKVDHGTANRGTRQWMAKLTEADVRTIRDMAATGRPQAEMVARFGIAQSAVSNIVNRKQWAWLD